jgi:cytochrome c biogenesis protein CcdA
MNMPLWSERVSKMSFVVAAPEALVAAASNVADIGSALTTAHAAAAAPTTGVLAAAADEVSTQIAAAFSRHGLGFQELGAQAAAFHEQFVAALAAGASSYAAAEAGVVKTLVNAVNAPAEALLGHSLIGNGLALGGGALPTAVSRVESLFSGNFLGNFQSNVAGLFGGAVLARPTGGVAAAAASGSLSQLGTLTGAMSVPAAGGIPGAIEALYNAWEPYVQYAFSLVAYAAGFVVPFAQQINYLYALFEPMFQSALFNTLDWLGGEITFVQGLSNFWAATTASINQFIYTEINWVRGFLPPLPPI